MSQPEDLNQFDQGQQPDESFADLERDLRAALQYVDPPKGFAERTMARARASSAPRGKLLVMPQRLRTWGSGAIAAALVAGFLIGQQVQHRRQAQIAQQQFEAGMRITDHALEHTRQQLERAGVNFGDD